MNPQRHHELIYFGMAWQIWSESGQYKGTSVVREIRIQAMKLVRMCQHKDMGLTYPEMLGEPPSKNLQKRRGKVHVRAERQYKALLVAIQNMLQVMAEQGGYKRKLTKAELRNADAVLKKEMMKVVQIMKERYPITLPALPSGNKRLST